MMELTKNGVPFTDWLTASATVALRTLANDFSFTATAVDGVPAPKKGDEMTIIVEGQLVLTGHIEEINGSEAEGSHTLTYSGRDLTGDFIDSDINVLDDIRASQTLTLKRIIEAVIDHLSLDLKVVDNLSPKPFNEAEDIIAAKVGQNALEFVMGYARKRQALLTSTGKGEILITQSEPTDSGATVQRLQGSDTNNILTQRWRLSDTSRFNKYIRRGQLDPRALNFAGTSSSTTIENQGGEFIDKSVRVGRQQVVVESESYSSGQLQDRAKWARQQAEAAGTAFTCTVKDHLHSAGKLWGVNTLVQVNSNVADISRKMLLDVLTFSEGDGQPTISSLEFVERNVYTIDDKVLAQKPAGSQSNVFKF